MYVITTTVFVMETQERFFVTNRFCFGRCILFIMLTYTRKFLLGNKAIYVYLYEHISTHKNNQGK